jgi:hypothetical protein
MTANFNYGKAAVGPVTILSDMPIDMSEGQPLPPTLGKTEVPVCMIQGPTLDFGPTVPALQLRLTLRPEATPGQVALDLFRLYAAVNELELSHHGAGLMPGDAVHDETPPNGTLSVTFKPAARDGAAERLATVVSAIHDAQDYPSLQRCEAMVVSVAA